MRVLFVSLIVVVIDQVSKILVKGFSIPIINFKHLGIGYGHKMAVLGKYFNITLVENPGIAFGINFGSEFKLLITIFTIITSGLLVYYLYNSRNKSFGIRFSIALIIGGAFGNLIDRTFYGVFYGYAPIFYGKVVDFLEFKLFSVFLFHGTAGNYIFNFADLAVTLGVFSLILNYIRKEKQEADPVPIIEPEKKADDKSIENYLADN